MLTETQINTRKPVWLALSDLWLDTELDSRWLDSIAVVLVESGLSLDELRDIYRDEVAPVVYANLLSPAGVWAGFDEAWLHQTIVDSLQRRGIFGRLALCFKRRLMLYATEDHWQYLAAKVVAIRARQ